MKIHIVNKRNSKHPKDIKLEDGLIFIVVTEEEAISLIQSMSSQISYKDKDSGRIEFHSKEGIRFSIVVSDFRYTKQEHNKYKIQYLIGGHCG